MSIDKSLKLKGALIRHRNVLKRGERIDRLTEDGRWTEETGSIFGLPKVRNIMAAKKKKTEAKEGEAAAGTAAAAEAPKGTKA